MQRIFIIIVFFTLSIVLFGQVFRTQPLSSDIKTIQVTAMGEWNSLPIISLNSPKYVLIEFDYLNDIQDKRLRYNIYHCDADWILSKNLSEIDYLDGFNDNQIEDYSASINTTVDYTNYRIKIPNEYIKLKLSGNYVVKIFDEDNPEEILLTACFSVSENVAQIGYKVSTVTNIDTNKEHQQVSLYITPNIRLINPNEELKLFVRQNNRLDNQRKGLKPQTVSSNRITYEQNKDLIFSAGNEYRRFEISNTKIKGLNVSEVSYNPPYFYANIEKDKPRNLQGYNYDQDQNGAFLIRSSESDNYETGADYVMTTFTLSVDEYLSGNVFLNGAFTYNTFNEASEMKFDNIEKEYKLSLLLKQGVYNYQYLTNNLQTDYYSQIIEGNYHQTENQYSAYLYYHSSVERFDRLLGVQVFYSREK